MPGPLIAPLIGAGASILGGIFNYASNKKNREHQQAQYEREKRDNLDQWNRQNSYNDPRQQRARLIGAGLNPALMYGQNSGGASGNASPIQKATQGTPIKTGGYNFDGIGQSANQYMNNIYDFKMKDAQTDNLLASTQTQKATAIQKAADTANTITKTSKNKFDLNLANQLRSTSVQAAQENLRQTQAKTQIALSQEERQTALTSASLQESAERILSSRLNRTKTVQQKLQIQQQIKNLKTDNNLKNIDLQFKQIGLYPHSPTYLKMLSRIVGPTEMLQNAKASHETIKNIADKIQNFKFPWQ